MADPTAETIRKLWEHTIRDSSEWESGDPTLTYKPVTTGGGAIPSISPAAFLPTESTIDLPALGEDGEAPRPVPLEGSEYELVERIGEGGMGVIWRARQRSLAREVALKQAKFDPAAEHAHVHAEQFLSEARVTGYLDHPNIVPVYVLGQDGNGGLFLSMKLVGGTSWRDLMHPWTPELRARAAKYDLEGHLGILIAVCNAIAFAHSRKVAHLDLKPANVMVGDFGEVLVMDWGIAVDISELPGKTATGFTTGRTRHHTAILAPAGTPAYLAPEMALGRGPQIGPWTDVYLLGAILHEIITGEPPHKGETISDVLREASESGPKEYGPDVPGALAEICRTAMSRDTRERYQTAGQFQVALRSFLKYRESMQIAQKAGEELEKLSGPDVRYRDTGKRYETYADVISRYRQALELWTGNEDARQGLRETALAYARVALDAGDLGLAGAQLELLPWEDAGAREMRDSIEQAKTRLTREEQSRQLMRRGLVGLAAVIFIGVTIGLIWIWRERDETKRREREATTARLAAESQRRKSEKQRQEFELEAEKSKAVLQFLQRMLSSASPDREGREVRVMDLLDGSERELAESFADRPVIRATIRHTIARTLSSLGELDRAEALMRTSEEERAEALGEEHADTLLSRFDLATVLYRRGRYADAEATLRGLLEARRRVLGEDDRQTLRTATALAAVLTVRGTYAEAEAILRDALLRQERAFETKDSDTQDTMFDLVAVLRDQAKDDEADAMLSRLLHAERDAFSTQQVHLFFAREKLDKTVAIQRRLMEAEGGFREWLMRPRRAKRASGLDGSTSADSIARVIKTLSRGDESAKVCRDIIVTRVKLLGTDHPRTIQAIHDLGLSFLKKGEAAEAEATLREVLTMRRRIFGDDHPDTLSCERSHAEALAASGDLERASRSLRSALETQNATLGSTHPESLRTVYALATVLEKKGERAGAAKALRELMDLAGDNLAGNPFISGAPERLRALTADE